MQPQFAEMRRATLLTGACAVPGLEGFMDDVGPKVSRIYSDEDVRAKSSHSYNRNVICQLLTHIPDSVINYNQKVTMPARKECIGVAMFADISGFTALCEKYADMVTKDSGCGTDKLTATLNNYIGKIVDNIIKDGGDVLKFAGDAILASWVFSHSGHNIKTVLAKAIRCGLSIQEKCDNQLTEVGVLLRVKIAMAVGSMVITFVGETDSKQFDLSGSAIDEVGAAEKHAKPSDVILTHLAWTNCDQDMFSVKKLKDVMCYKVSENKRIVEKHKVGVGIASNINGMFSDMQNTALASSKQVVICPEVDALIAKCPDCHYDLPKALLPDTEDAEIRRFAPAQVVGMENRRANADKDRKFDRQKMNFNLDDEQVVELRSYVATPVLDKLDHGQDLEWLSEMRQVSVLFINMKLPDGSEDAAQALQKAFEIIYEAMLKFKGNLNKVFSFDKGCTFVVIFGLPGGKHEDDAARALRSGHMIYESLHAVAEITDECIGVTTGKAFCGVVGHKDRHEYTVIGRKVNMAARLMTNYPGILSCDPETYEAAKSKLKRTDFTNLPFKPLKGIKDPGIIREYNPSANPQDEEKEYEYPILGRENEVSRFLEVIQAVKQRTDGANIVTVEGEAGIGKTRLLEEMMDIAEDEGFRLNYIELDSSQSLTPFNVIGNFVSSLLGLEHCRSSLEKEHILFDVIKDDITRANLSLLNDLIGTEIATDPKFKDMKDFKRNACFHNLLLTLVQSVTECQPNIFFVDNAQFVDPESWQFFFDLVCESHTVLTLAMRTFSASNPAPCDAAIDLLNHGKTRRLALEGLHEDLMSDLACQMLQVYQIPKKLDYILRTKSNGVPSWCEQLVKQLVSTNVIQVGPSTMELPEVSESENQVSEASKSSIAQPQLLNPQYLPPAPTPTNSRRRWSVTKHITHAFKRASHALALPGHQSDSDDRFSEIQNFYKRRSSIESDSSDKSFRPPDFPRGRRMSMESGKSVRICLEMNETLYPLTEQTDETEEAPSPGTVSSSRRRSSETASKLLSMHSRLLQIETNYVYASNGVIPDDVDNICVICPGKEISDAIVPNSVNDVVVARIDRMSPNEQLILKCASVLGMNFTRDLLSAIVPRKISQVLDTTLYRLCKERLIECGSLALQQAHNHNNIHTDSFLRQGSSHHNHRHRHHTEVKTIHHVFCGCYVDEGDSVIDLSQMNRAVGGKKRLCQYFHFSNSFVRDAAYDLWLEDQRKALHERAALYLETQVHVCKPCGGDSFVPGLRSKMSARSNVVYDSVGKASARMERKKIQASTHLQTKVRPKGTLFTKILHGDNRANIPQEELQSETAYFSKQRQAGTRGEGIGRALVDMAGMITQGIVDQTQPKSQFKTMVQKIRGRNKRVAPDPESMTRAVLAEFQKLLSTGGERPTGDFRRPSLGGGQKGSDKTRARTVDVSECHCSEVIATIFPQLVFHWRSAQNELKTFHYLIESAAAFVSIHSNMQALSYLNEIETIIQNAEGKNDYDEAFFISTDDKARVEFLNGQALMNMNRVNEAVKHFISSLKHLGNSHPTTSFWIFVRTKIAYMTQILHRRMPDTFKERSDETSRIFIEQARCFTHLSHAYHLQHDKKRSFMVALEHLNTVEEAEEDWIELVTSFSIMIECCQLTNKLKLGTEYERIALSKIKQEYSSVEELLTAVQLHSVLLAFRFFKGHLTSAINAGYEALHLANTVSDLRVKITVIPLLSQALLLLSRVQACHEVLQELRKAAAKLEDLHGQALYFCCCMDLLLEPGRPLESLKKCKDFARHIINDPALSGDVIPRFCLNASLALMFARQRKWHLALPYYNAALELEPEYSDMFLYCRAYAKIVEYNLLSFREHKKDPKEKAICKEVIKKFKRLAKKNSVLLPRLFHLQAYFAYLRGKSSRARLLIEDCLVASRSIEPMFEVDWAMWSKNHWFSDHVLEDATEEYDGRSRFLLPR